MTLVALVIVGVGAALRVAAINGQGLWHDELYTLGNLVGFDIYLFPGADLSPTEPVRTAGSMAAVLEEDRFVENLWRNLVHEGHPPLYLLMLKCWTLAFGTTIVWVRGFSVLCSTLAIIAMMAVGTRAAGGAAGLAAGLLFATSPYQVYFAAESRSYSLMVLCAAVSTWAWLGLISEERRRDEVAWAIAVSAACLTHYFGALYAGLLWLTLGALQLSQSPARSTARVVVRRALPLLAGVAWLPVLRLQTDTHGGSHWTEGRLPLVESVVAGIKAPLEFLTSPHGSAAIGESLLAVCMLVISVGWLVVMRDRPWAKVGGVLLGVVSVHMMVVVAVDQAIDHHLVSVPRYSSSLAIPLLLVVAMSLTRLRSAGTVLLLTHAAFSLGAARDVGAGGRAPKQMLREVASHLNDKVGADALVLVSPSGPTLLGLSLYLRPDIRVAAVPAEDLPRAVETAREDGYRVWSVQQRLGIGIEPWAADQRPQAVSVVRFAGVDLAQH